MAQKAIGKPVIPWQTNWAQVAGALRRGQCVWVPTLERVWALEKRMYQLGRNLYRGRMADGRYLVWHAGMSSDVGMPLCGSCLVGRHDECLAGDCECALAKHPKPVIPGRSAIPRGRPPMRQLRQREESERATKWDLVAGRMTPGDAMLVHGYAKAFSLEMAIKALPAYARKASSGRALYVVWHLGPRDGHPLDVCQGCEKGWCHGYPDRCYKGLVRGKRSPVACDCQHGPVMQAESGETLGVQRARADAAKGDERLSEPSRLSVLLGTPASVAGTGYVSEHALKEG